MIISKSTKILIGISLIVIVLLISITWYYSILGIILPYLALIPLTASLLKIILDNGKIKKIQGNIVESFVHPAATTLVTFLKKQNNISIEQIDNFIRESEKQFRQVGDLTPTILYMCNLFSTLQKIEDKYHHSYTLAVAYTLFTQLDIKDGQSAREINSSVTKRKVIHVGSEKWTISDENATWYMRFIDSERLLHVKFSEIFEEVKEIKSNELEEKQLQINNEAQYLAKLLEDKKAKLNKLLDIVVKEIPEANISKIISSLRTEIVIISSQGKKGNETSIRGSKYLNQALDAEGIEYGRLNYSVRFVFLNDIMKDHDARYFDPHNWGKQIEERANRLRLDELGHDDSPFNFAILKSSLQDLQFFGDKIEDGRIKIPPGILEGVKSEDATFSTLQIIAKMLQQRSLSLSQFIDKNLEYLDGIHSTEDANKIISGLGEKFNKQSWSISDFITYKVTTDDLINLNFSESQANQIITEAKTVSSFLPS